MQIKKRIRLAHSTYRDSDGVHKSVHISKNEKYKILLTIYISESRKIRKKDTSSRKVDMHKNEKNKFTSIRPTPSPT